VESGEVIAYVGKASESLPDESRDSAPSKEVTKEVIPEIKTPPVAPVVANLASRLSVNLAEVQGTGEGGRITREDVLQASRQKERKVDDSQGQARAQAAVARAVAKSNSEIPHLRAAMTIELTKAEKQRSEPTFAGTKHYYDALFLRAMGKAAEQVSEFVNQISHSGEERQTEIDVALAVGFGNDLLLPVVRDVTGKELASLQTEVTQIVERAKLRTLKAEELGRGCMTLSNLGMYPVDWFEAMIFPGQIAVLALGKGTERPVAYNGRLEVRRMVTVTLSADHRIINGRVAAEYLTRLKELIESGEIA
jgi:pyruvate dehydrogenase E2 component (dihydrolipoamide acetyltransferase)